VIGTYPALTTTFIDREITFLRRMGVNLNIVAVRRPSGTLSAEQELIQQGVSYLLPARIWLLVRAHVRLCLLRPSTFFGTLFYLLTRPHPDAKSRLKTLLHFGEGVYAAYILGPFNCEHIHAHFIDRAATIALVASRFLDIPYSITAHANDIYVRPTLLTEKLSKATFVATCTAYNKAYLSRLSEDSANGKVKCIYHGLDLRAFQDESLASEKKAILMTVGQLKEKKGFTYLLKACRMLKDQGYDFECQIIGEGPLRNALEQQISQLSLQETVILCGALPHQEVVKKYGRSTVFVLPCVVGADGDRDGIPNVILEAMAMQLPVVSTHHSGIPEVIEHQVNGVLVPPADEAALAEALAKLMNDPHTRQQLGYRARQTIAEKFNVEQNARQLLAEFRGPNAS
jgi:glycosyltransferase involved in cell wall biosynthesis